MGIKKIARPINKAKNEFVKWLKNNDGKDIDVYYGDDGDTADGCDGWDYYCCVSGFVKDVFYTAYFTIWNGTQKIEYFDDENSYNDLTIQELSDMFDLNCV